MGAGRQRTRGEVGRVSGMPLRRRIDRGGLVCCDLAGGGCGLALRRYTGGIHAPRLFIPIGVVFFMLFELPAAKLARAPVRPLPEVRL